jgi:secreted PhoX family phosphatase
LSHLNRRDLFRVLGGAAAAGALEGLTARAALALSRDRAGIAGLADGAYGALAPAAARNTGETLLALPEGFSYTVFGGTGSVMSDGRPTPPQHDGMAAFQSGGELRLVRNHEVGRQPEPALAPPEVSYDPVAGGGTTTLIVDPVSRTLVRDFVSLSGTLINCAGGPTPWGTWISCEETTAGPANGFERPHGYCFEVTALGNEPAACRPLTAMGRFVHEAVALDPETGIVYLTEDRLAAGFYRFIPLEPGQLAAGGRLQMLAIRGEPGYDTRTGQRPLEWMRASWVTIGDPDSERAGPDPSYVFLQGSIAGGATFARLEGAWSGNGRIYINATSGGDARLGQVWEYQPRSDGGRIRLLFESPSADVLESPDNICVSPRGRGMVLCEDGAGDQFLRGLTREGRIFDLARNLVPGHETSEFAGATFSPDRQTLFVNIQSPGLTFAIWGPWERGAL